MLPVIKFTLKNVKCVHIIKRVKVRALFAKIKCVSHAQNNIVI